MVAMFCDYPEEMVAHVCNPARGLPSKLTFLPSLAEIKQALEAEMEPVRREWERQWRRLQAKAISRGDQLELTPEERRKAVEPALQFVREMRERESAKTHWLSPAELRAMGGLSDDQWDAIPNAASDGWRKLR